MSYIPRIDRYENMQYRRTGRSGLLLPMISLGFWHNFGVNDDPDNCRNIVREAFDAGITHFDLANNYGPPAGQAEISFGRILKQDLLPYRDEIIVSSKAGYEMWPGPYGNFGSRKYLMASIDQSLKRTGLDYFDIFYHHRPDPDTPLEESMMALDSMVRQGKALYVGISSYSASETEAAAEVLASLGTPLLIHQPKYSLLERSIENGLLEVLKTEEIGCIVFSALAQGLLTNKYLNGIPEHSRAASHRGNGAIDENQITAAYLKKAKALDAIARARGQSLAQMSLAWVLKDARITSVIVGASKPAQLSDSIGALKNCSFAPEELDRIDAVLQSNH